MGTKPKKRFSQNFLADKKIARKIVGLLDLTTEDTVFEIGSGRGTLTWFISDSGAKLFTFEIDRELMGDLEGKFGGKENIRVINEDFLKVVPSDYCEEPFKLIGNIPYDITSPLLDWIIGNRKKIKKAVITTQKELGERIASSPGSKDWAPIAIFCQCFFEVKKEFTISAAAFYPPPKIKSVTLSLVPAEKYQIKDWGNFSAVVRQAFLHRRKQLVNNLGLLPGISKEWIGEILYELGLDRNIRAEALSIQEFLKLAEKVRATESS